MLISFIVPVYNVYKYVRRCVESLTAQTYSDIEVILVDDGRLMAHRDYVTGYLKKIAESG